MIAYITYQRNDFKEISENNALIHLYSIKKQDRLLKQSSCKAGIICYVTLTIK